MTRRPPLLAVAVLAAAAVLAVAGLAPRAAPPPDLAAQTRAVAASLACPTCAGESAADSSAPLARAMRAEIRERLAAGERPADVRAWFVERYGEGVLLDPPRRGAGWLLVAGPVAGLLAGAAAVGLVVRRRSLAAAPEPGPAERLEVERLLSTYRRGWSPGESPGQERLEAALGLLEEVRARREDDALPVREVVRLLREPVTAEPEAADPRRRLAAVPSAVLLAGILGVGAVPLAGLPRGGGDGVAAAGVAASAEASRDGAQGDDAVAARLAEARALESAGRLEDASRAYRQVLAQRPQDAAVAFRLGFALVRLDRAAEAEPFLRQVLAASPAHPEALLLLGSAQRERSEPEAEALLRRFLDVAPSHPAAERVRTLLEDA